ncbi:20608_t:CDS:2, partial [Racocetra persica]
KSLDFDETSLELELLTGNSSVTSKDLQDLWFKDFVADLKFVESSELPNKCICGYKFSSVTIDPIKYLLFLFNNLKEKNVTFIKQEVKKLELDSFDGIVIDCVGLNSGKLFDHILIPRKGQLIRISKQKYDLPHCSIFNGNDLPSVLLSININKRKGIQANPSDHKPNKKFKSDSVFYCTFKREYPENYEKEPTNIVFKKLILNFFPDAHNLAKYEPKYSYFICYEPNPSDTTEKLLIQRLHRPAWLKNCNFNLCVQIHWNKNDPKNVNSKLEDYVDCVFLFDDDKEFIKFDKSVTSIVKQDIIDLILSNQQNKDKKIVFDAISDSFILQDLENH